VAKHRLVALPQRGDARGHLLFAQEGSELPFTPRRLFVIFDVAADATRGGHAQRAQHQFLMMLQGGCTVEVDDGRTKMPVRLETREHGLYVPPRVWLDLREFTPGAICGVLASDRYDEADYIRNYESFLRETSGAPAQ
jgi:hypothetical protein